MRAAVVQFPGSNADLEATLALREAGFEVEFTFHKSSAFAHAPDLVVIPGGFAFGDHLRAGALARTSPIAQALVEHQRRGGLTLGICNGFQVLLELGMLPGALLPNVADSSSRPRFGFRAHEVHLRCLETGAFTRAGDAVTLPIAHAFGRYHCGDALLARLRDSGQIALRYEENPNGSVADIAGVYDKEKRTLGLMPHPERASLRFAGGPPRRLDGLRFFRTAAQVICQ